MRLLLGTNNRGKIIEMMDVLRDLPLQILTLSDLNITHAPEEHGATYEENALLKAQFFHEASSKLPTVADDSGIIVDALQGELGMNTRRWGVGPTASDEEWIKYFLERMKLEPNKRAQFICTLAFVDANGAERVFEGRCSGEITKQLEADYLPGLPISACFRPDGHKAVFSALSLEQKNSTSHRGRAVLALKEFLQRLLRK
ncbi:MAG TPA: non-canonical purine NTP pyrophosphatase [Candidatus Peribacteraceae bacterium]|nr:non-canonical purine NTP pyrophosphatase [Candidatus Peribacteraceae bacterium]